MKLCELPTVNSATLHAECANKTSLECSIEIKQRNENFFIIRPALEDDEIEWLSGRPAALYMVCNDWCYRFDVMDCALAKNSKGMLCLKVPSDLTGKSYNRRRYIRYPVDIQCQVVSQRSSMSCEARIIDMSIEGMGIRSDIPYNTGSQLKVTFVNPYSGSDNIETVYVTVVRSDGDTMGCQIAVDSLTVQEVIGELRRQYNREVVDNDT